MFNIQCAMFNVQYSRFNVLCCWLLIFIVYYHGVNSGVKNRNFRENKEKITKILLNFGLRSWKWTLFHNRRNVHNTMLTFLYLHYLDRRIYVFVFLCISLFFSSYMCHEWCGVLAVYSPFVLMLTLNFFYLWNFWVWVLWVIVWGVSSLYFEFWFMNF